MNRKEQSEAVLQAHRIKINPHLPDLGETAVKAPEVLLRRALTALLAAQVAIDAAEDHSVIASALFFRAILQRFGLENELTPENLDAYLSAEEKLYRELDYDALVRQAH